MYNFIYKTEVFLSFSSNFILPDFQSLVYILYLSLNTLSYVFLSIEWNLKD